MTSLNRRQFFKNAALFAGGVNNGGQCSLVVDIYNNSSGLWTTANLSQARNDLRKFIKLAEAEQAKWLFVY